MIRVLRRYSVAACVVTIIVLSAVVFLAPRIDPATPGGHLAHQIIFTGYFTVFFNGFLLLLAGIVLLSRRGMVWYSLMDFAVVALLMYVVTRVI